MHLIKELIFTHANEEYAVRAISDGATIHIRVFKGRQPANGYRYSIDVNTSFDFGQYFGQNGMDHMMDGAKDDVIEGRWEKYLEAVRQSTP